jgi:hypothetical protein
MTSFKIDVKGLKVVDGQLASLPVQLRQAIGKGLMATALVARSDAQRRILDGPKTGRVYQKSNPKRTHRASAPGEAPANDLGFLASQIFAEPSSEPMTVNLTSRAPYSVYLEYGTMRIRPRPFLRPAAEFAAKQGSEIVGAYVQQVFGRRK